MSANYSTIKYALGENPEIPSTEPVETFDSIPALVTSYNRRKLPNYDVIISEPVQRKLPLSFSQHKYASLRKKKSDVIMPHSNSVSSMTSSTNSSPLSTSDEISSSKSSSSWKRRSKRGSTHLASPFVAKEIGGGHDVIDMTSSPVAQQPTLPVAQQPPKPSRIPSQVRRLTESHQVLPRIGNSQKLVFSAEKQQKRKTPQKFVDFYIIFLI